MTDAYSTGIEITEQLRAGDSLLSSVAESSIQTEYLDDSYPEWHPAPHAVLGMVRLLIYREATGTSYRALARYQELAEPLDLEHILDESVLSRTWRKRFDDGVRELVQVAAKFVIKQTHDREFSAPAVRPKVEIVDGVDLSTDDEAAGCEFSDEQIYRTTRLARDHGFDEFDSGRAANASYEDTRFFELQTFIGMVNCGTPQGAARFRHRQGSDSSPHGDTHLRTIKQFAPGELIDGFDAVADRLLSVIEFEGYDWMDLREKLREQGVRPLIKHRIFQPIDHAHNARVDGPRYRQRSMCETVFSSIKRSHGDAVRARTWYREFRELVVKCVVHNIKRVLDQ
jgi:IS5 family transposase